MQAPPYLAVVAGGRLLASADDSAIRPRIGDLPRAKADPVEDLAALFFGRRVRFLATQALHGRSITSSEPRTKKQITSAEASGARKASDFSGRGVVAFLRTTPSTGVPRRVGGRSPQAPSPAWLWQSWPCGACRAERRVSGHGSCAVAHTACCGVCSTGSCRESFSTAQCAGRFSPVFQLQWARVLEDALAVEDGRELPQTDTDNRSVALRGRASAERLFRSLAPSTNSFAPDTESETPTSPNA